MLRESRIKPRALFAKPLSAAVAMGTGGPFGAEGPIIASGAPHRVEFDTEVDPFRTVVAGQAMDPLPEGKAKPCGPSVDRSSTCVTRRRSSRQDPT